ncbi:14907_t:CDS:2, partial [Entrophospora sp. SA101]
GARKESRLTTSLIDDENYKFNLLNGRYVSQNTFYEIKIKSRFLKHSLINLLNMETFSVKAICESSKPNKCDSDNENNIHFLILPAIDVYGKRKV